MGKFFLVACGLLMGVAEAANAPMYLAFFNAGRDARFDLRKARILLAVAQGEEKRDTRLLEIMAKARARNAVSEIDYREALMKKEMSVAKVKMGLDRVKALEGEISQHDRQAKLAEAGTAPQSEIDSLYADYLYQWAYQCTSFKSEAEFFKANVAYTNYKLTSSRKLLEKNVITEAEVLNDEVEHLAAEEGLQSAEKIERECWDGVPTLDKIQKMVGPKP